MTMLFSLVYLPYCKICDRIRKGIKIHAGITVITQCFRTIKNNYFGEK